MTGVKRHLRYAFDRAGALTGLIRYLEHSMRRGVTILTYHRILPRDECLVYPFPSLALPEDAFRRQLGWLSHHCRVLPVREALRECTSDRAMDAPLVCLTFDDGYHDNYDVVAKILDEFDARATFFVTAAHIGSDRMLWFDEAAVLWATLPRQRLRQLERLVPGAKTARIDQARSASEWVNHLKKWPVTARESLLDEARSLVPGNGRARGFRLMQVDQVLELSRAGHEIASHTLSHPILPLLDDHDLAKELTESRAMIEHWTGTGVAGFCYPNGDFDGRVLRAVRACGYTYACTTRSGRNEASQDRMQLSRINVQPTAITTPSGQYDELAFRSELCRFRQLLRKTQRGNAFK